MQLPDPVKPTQYSSSDQEETQHKLQLDRELKEMVNTITSHVSDLHKPGGSQHHDVNADENGVRIITLAGTNTGATMRTELDDKKGNKLEPELDDAIGTYVNSNFQSVNNSIMFHSNYGTNDPGVHMDISDTYQPHGHRWHDHNKHGKKGKKIEKGSFISDEHEHEHEHDHDHDHSHDDRDRSD